MRLFLTYALTIGGEITARPMYAYFWGVLTNGVRLFMGVYSMKKNQQTNNPSFVWITEPFIIAVSCGPVSTKGCQKTEPKKSFKHSANTMN